MFITTKHLASGTRIDSPRSWMVRYNCVMTRYTDESCNLATLVRVTMGQHLYNILEFLRSVSLEYDENGLQTDNNSNL
jgi:hypothetical protein